MKKVIKSNIAIKAAGVLLCLVLISAHFTSGLYARYISRARDGDRSRVSAFAVRADMIQEDTGEYTLSLSNQAEVPVRYSVTVTLHQSLPDGSIAAAELNGVSMEFDESGAVTFPDVGVLSSGSGATATLSISADFSGSTGGAAVEDFDNDSISVNGWDCPFTVTVQYVQIN